MNRRTNLINNVIYLGLTMCALFLVVYVCNLRYSVQLVDVCLKLLVGSILASFVVTFAHEMGHVIGGKKAGFAVLSVTVWFFKWTKVGKKKKFSFTLLGSEAGFTELVPTTDENLDKRLKKATSAAYLSTIPLTLIGVIPLFIMGLSLWGYCLLAAFLPAGIYTFFGNALPMTNEGFLNDGAIVSGIKKNDDSVRVAVSLLAIQSQLYQGKTPAEIDEKLYFDLPQLPEDDPNFIMLLNARYNYYLDKGDFNEAKAVSNRLLAIAEDYMPKEFIPIVKADALFNACTFDANDDVADDLMYELEKYLNKNNTLTNLRIKLAYIVRVNEEKSMIDTFYAKGVKEADKCQIKGLCAIERKLIEQLVK